jgi:hypothetical protein
MIILGLGDENKNKKLYPWRTKIVVISIFALLSACVKIKSGFSTRMMEIMFSPTLPKPPSCFFFQKPYLALGTLTTT